MSDAVLDQPSVDAFQAEVGQLLERHHERLVQHLDQWMAHFQKTCGATPAFMSSSMHAPPSLSPTPLELMAFPRSNLGGAGGYRMPVSHESTERTVVSKKPAMPVSHESTERTVGSKKPVSRTPSDSSGYRRDVVRKVNTGFSLISPVDDVRTKWERRHRLKSSGILSAHGEEVTHDASLYERFQRIVKSHHFEIFFALVIITNTIFVGVQTQYAASNPERPTRVELVVVAQAYALIFTLELALRVAAYRCSFFHSPGSWRWNWFDVLLVGISLLEAGLDVADQADGGSERPGQSQGAAGMRMLRFIRITKLVRALRIMRIMRFVAPLRMLVFTIVSTLKSLVWSLVLLAILFYSFGILFTQATSEYLFDEAGGAGGTGGLPQCPPGGDGDPPAAIRKHFGGLGGTMFTLFKSITGGISWTEVVDPLGSVGWPWVALFTVYIAFTVFAVLNVVTSIFCQSAIETSQQDHVALIHNQIQHKEKYLSMLRGLFRDLDSDNSGSISLDEFQDNLEREDMQAYLDSLGLSPDDALVLFKLLDVDGTCNIDVEDFMMGCLRLRGTATSIDMATIMNDQKALGKRLRRIGESVGTLAREQQATQTYLRALCGPRGCGPALATASL